MKTREDAIKVADLLAVAHFEEELVIFIDSEEGISPTSLAVQANFETGEFGPVQPLEIYLELKPFESIDDIDAQISIRHRLIKEMSKNAIDEMLKEFNKEYGHVH
ncbi:MAG: hypothetical protein KBG80_12090 [Breznakibacter sp.]|nr:hypothetical protein [Breznakibacter sp.]